VQQPPKICRCEDLFDNLERAKGELISKKGKFMSEIEKTKNTNASDEDWAILPFDQEEDDARWTKLSGEMEELIEKTESAEKLSGTILMEEDLSRFVYEKSQTESGEADGDGLF
jgi:hypothetical protein